MEFKKLVTSPPSSAMVDGVCESRRMVVFDKTNSTRFLIDTGSDVSILPATRSDRCYGSEKQHLHAANGTRIRTFGTKFVSIDLGLRRKFTWNFLIADVTLPIVGADFLAKFGILVDLKKPTAD